jgi:hypothetical protein
MLGPGCLPSKPPISQIVSPTSTAGLWVTTFGASGSRFQLLVFGS